MRVTFLCTLLMIFTLGIAFGQDTNFSTGPQYLENSGSPLFARPISTPTMSFSTPPLEVGASNATGVLIAGAEDRTVVPPLAVAEPSIDLLPVLYGEHPASVIEIGFPSESTELSSPTTLPIGIFDPGVGEMTTPQALRESGYGVSLPQAVAHIKARFRPAAHIYTNADIDRLPRGD